jgi:hypothetical protein
MDHVTVTVKALDGHCLEVEVPVSGSVRDITTQLKQQYGLPKCSLYRQVSTPHIHLGDATHHYASISTRQCCMQLPVAAVHVTVLVAGSCGMP